MTDIVKAAEAAAKAAEAASKLIPVEQVYKDIAQGAAQEVGKAGTDAARVARLLLAPVQVLAAYQVRFERFCRRLAERVPEERRVEIPARVSGPVLEALRYIDEQDIVAEYMLNLLASAMDSDHAGDVHPSFSAFASELSPDEALLLFHLKKRSFRNIFTRELDRGPPMRWKPPVLELVEFPEQVLAHPQHLSVYVSHLYFMGLAQVVKMNEDSLREDTNDPNKQTGIRVTERIELTELGRMFARACVPDELPDAGA